MARSSKLEIAGGRELNRALEALPGKVARKVVSGALRAGGTLIVKEARRRAPRETGELARNIAIRKATKRQRRRLGLEQGALVIGVKGPRARIVHLIEFGFMRGRTRVAAQPFLRPALDSKAARAIKRIAERMGKGIEREAAKLARSP